MQKHSALFGSSSQTAKALFRDERGLCPPDGRSRRSREKRSKPVLLYGNEPTASDRRALIRTPSNQTQRSVSLRRSLNPGFSPPASV